MADNRNRAGNRPATATGPTQPTADNDAELARANAARATMPTGSGDRAPMDDPAATLEAARSVNIAGEFANTLPPAAATSDATVGDTSPGSTIVANRNPAPVQPADADADADADAEGSKASKIDENMIAAVAAGVAQATTKMRAPAPATVGLNVTRPGGYYFHQGNVVNANGYVIDDAPEEDKKLARRLWAESQGFTPEAEE